MGLTQLIGFEMRRGEHAFVCPVLPRKQDDAAAKTFRYEGSRPHLPLVLAGATTA